MLYQITPTQYLDTDDLNQEEYHYFRKALDLGHREIAVDILKGGINAFDIEQIRKLLSGRKLTMAD